jgi:YHS domain-containing protein
MATDPVCGMFVEEKPESIQNTVDGRKYYFCSTQCLKRQKPSKRGAMHVKDERKGLHADIGSLKRFCVNRRVAS